MLYLANIIMGHRMKAYEDSISKTAVELKGFLENAGKEVVVLSHVDADGLCAATILKRFLKTRGIAAHHVYPAKGENAYTPGTARRLAALKPDRLFVLDLGVTAEPVLAGVPTLVIDHHRPFGQPEDAIVLSSYGTQPAPPTSLLTYDVVSRLTDIKDVAWLAVVGTAGDLGSDFAFSQSGDLSAEMTKSNVREAEVIINSAKRASAYDIATAVRLVDHAGQVSDLIDHSSPEVVRLEASRQEVNREVKRCRHERPHFSWKVAIIPFESPCDIQGLIAETWRRQLENYLVIAANFGYIEGKVAYVIRTELNISVIDFMESLKPAGYGGHVVFGHDRAGGAVLDRTVWLELTDRMRFRPSG